jgi:hypothetical protein
MALNTGSPIDPILMGEFGAVLEGVLPLEDTFSSIRIAQNSQIDVIAERGPTPPQNLSHGACGCQPKADCAIAAREPSMSERITIIF